MDRDYVTRNEAARAAKRISVRSLPTDKYLGAEEVPSQHDDAEMLAAALGRLDADDRELVELKIFGSLTFREIADITVLPQGTVATRYRRALESLRGWLAKQMR